MKDNLVKAIVEKYEYNPEDGFVLYKNARAPYKPGDRAGYHDKKFHNLRLIAVNGKQFAEQRVAWALMTGTFPKRREVVHVNGDTADNRWSNLKKRDDLSVEENLVAAFRKYFDYNPETGWLTAKVKYPYFRGEVGDRVGSPTRMKNVRRKADTARMVRFHVKKFYEHVVMWAMMTGSFPDKSIDHKNGDPSDNRWGNLRLADASEQQWNREGATGVVRVKNRAGDYSKYVARCTLRGKTHYLGRFNTFDRANAAYLAFARKHHGDFFVLHSRHSQDPRVEEQYDDNY